MPYNITDNNMGTKTFATSLGSTVNSSSARSNIILKPETSDAEKSRRSSEQSRGRRSSDGLLLPGADERRRNSSFDQHRRSAVERDLAMNSKTLTEKKHKSIKAKVFSNKIVPSFLE